MKFIASQSDFASLDVPYELADKGLNTDETVVLSLPVSKQPADRTHAKIENEVSCEVFAPANVIPAEVLALIEAWESSYLSKTDHPACRMDLDSTLECVDYLEPPKRFTRTLQRSASRRMPAVSSLQSLNDDD